MKKHIVLAALLATVLTARAEQPLRVAVLEFQDQTGLKSDELLGGAVAPGAMAAKGVFILGKLLANQTNFVLIDRRDLMEQMERLRPKDQGERTPTKPSFLQAAQALRADVVLRGSLLSLSTGKQIVSPGGIRTEFSTLTVRVALEALDAKDGAVIAAADGVQSQNFRQSESQQTVLGEDDVFQLMEKSVAAAIPSLRQSLAAREERAKSRPTVKLAIKSSADPAMVEIDGILVGSTPIEGLEVYQGDHVLSVGKPGYQQVTKRILFEKDSSVEVPMIREQLTAEELAEIYQKIQLKVIQADPGVIVHTIDVE